MGHVDGLLLVGRRRRQKHEQVVPFSRRSFRGCLGVKIDQVDVINNDIGVVLLSPLFAESLVKPSVVGRNKMTPLKYLQSLLLRRSFFWKQNERA